MSSLLSIFQHKMKRIKYCELWILLVLQQLQEFLVLQPGQGVLVVQGIQNFQGLRLDPTKIKSSCYTTCCEHKNNISFPIMFYAKLWKKKILFHCYTRSEDFIQCKMLKQKSDQHWLQQKWQMCLVSFIISSICTLPDFINLCISLNAYYFDKQQNQCMFKVHIVLLLFYRISGSIINYQRIFVNFSLQNLLYSG